MNERRIEPDENFPDNLEELPNEELHVLNSKVYRQLEHETLHDGGPEVETEIRHHELSSEFAARDKADGDG